MVHQFLQPPAKESIDQAPLSEQELKVCMAVCSGLGLLPDFQNVKQHQQIEYSNDPQERPGDARTDHAAKILENGQLSLDCRGRVGDRNSENHYDGRMAEREEKSNAQRLLSLLQHKAHGVIDRRDVVSVEGMAQTEHVCD